MVCVFCNPSESRCRSVKIKVFVLLQVSLPPDRYERSAEFLQCAEDMDLFHISKLEYLTNVQVSTFRFLNVGLNQKCFLFFYIFFLCEDYQARRSDAYVLLLIIFLEAPHNALTSLQLSAKCGQDKTGQDTETSRIYNVLLTVHHNISVY
jgi:hypothetical protein